MKKILLLFSFFVVLTIYASSGFCVNYTQDANCMGAWLMDVDELNLTDSSGEGNTLALLGDGEPDYATASPPDVYSTGYYIFDGIDDRAYRTNFQLADTDGSVISWVNFDEWGEQKAFWSWGSTSGDTFTFNFGVRGDNDANPSVNDAWLTLRIVDNDFSPNSTVRGSTTSIILDTWTHLAYTSDGSNYHCYVDGISQTIDAYNGADNGSWIGDMSQPVGIYLFIGEVFYKATHINSLTGNMDEPAYFDDELTSTEVNDIMDNGLEGVAPSGWTHSYMGVPNANIAKINGIPIENIAKVNGI